MKQQIEGNVVDSSYVGQNGWVEQTSLETGSQPDFDDTIRPFIGKRVLVTIEELPEKNDK